MERKVIPETENRLVILYAMNCLGPVTDAQLLRFMVELDLMNYITLQLSMGELEEQGQIMRRAHPCGELWELKAEGYYAVEQFERRIPQSRREHMRTAAGTYRPLFRQEQLSTAGVTMTQNGTACLRLRMQEVSSMLMDLMLYVPADQVPTTLAERWRRCAQAAYGAVIGALTEGYAPDASLPPVPERSVRWINGNERLLMFSDDEKEPTIQLLLSIIGEHLAQWCAVRWPAVCKGLRELVLAQLWEENIASEAGKEVSGKGE